MTEKHSQSQLLRTLGELTAAGETTLARHRFAIFLIILSSIGFSFAGLITRATETTNPWHLNLYRSGFTVLVLGVLLVVRYGRGLARAVRSIGPAGLVASVLAGISPICYVFSLTTTTVANTVFIVATTPLYTAIGARLFLGERVRSGTWVAMGIAAIGVLLMVGESFALGSLFGNAMALACAIGFSCFAVIIRRHRALDMLPTLVLGGLLTCAISLAATWRDPFISLHDLLLCLVWGALIAGLLGNWLFIMAARHLAVAEATLIMLTEFVLAPLWVWWFVDEVPARYTLIGGVLVLVAVAGRALKDLLEAPPRVGRRG